MVKPGEPVRRAARYRRFDGVKVCLTASRKGRDDQLVLHDHVISQAIGFAGRVVLDEPEMFGRSTLDFDRCTTVHAASYSAEVSSARLQNAVQNATCTYVVPVPPSRSSLSDA